MGGSGGSSFSSWGSEALSSLQGESSDPEFEAECNAYLRDLLQEFNSRDVQAVRTHLDEIRDALGKELDGAIDLVFGGSVARHTYVEGFSDVDALVVLDNCELSKASPDEAKFYFINRLQERFPRTEISEGSLGVTLRFKDVDVQLLPAITCNGMTQISAEGGGKWATIEPRGFAQKLTQANEALSSKVVPTIKLAKAIIAQLPEKQRITGYHAESIAIEAFKGYTGPLTHKAMVKHFFLEGAKLVLTPIPDATGQSIHVDTSLGSHQSLERRVVSDGFARLARRMSNADVARSVDSWRAIYED